MTMTGLFNNGFGGLLPAVSVGGGVNYDTGGFMLDTGYFPWNNANPTYTYKDQISKILGDAQYVSSAPTSWPPRRTKRTAPMFREF